MKKVMEAYTRRRRCDGEIMKLVIMASSDWRAIGPSARASWRLARSSKRPVGSRQRSYDRDAAKTIRRYHMSRAMGEKRIKRMKGQRYGGERISCGGIYSGEYAEQRQGAKVNTGLERWTDWVWLDPWIGLERTLAWQGSRECT